jgi:hypothetical protein
MTSGFLPRAAFGLAMFCAVFSFHAIAADSMADMPMDAAGDDDPMPMKSMGMSGTLGTYAFTRDGSGTSWQPDSSVHQGLHIMDGDSMYMAHARLNFGYDWQQGRRGGDGTLASGMIMGSARKGFENGDALTFRAMLSPDPVMGPRGYPLLLAAGESADGKTLLTDRQHPHDLFMELSATYSHAFSDEDSVFVYAGWPGEPAFGPPAFMHRMSIMDSPEAPITHHWMDSTHITFGVVTGGVVHDNWKLEASGFKGREPDENRTDIEAAKFDSASVRLSWNPTEELALQASWAKLTSPEQLEPTLDQKRLSVSAIYTRPLGDGWWSTTVGWGRKQVTGDAGLNAWMLESAVKPNEPWTIFLRGELADNDELYGHGGGTARVGKVSLGAIHDWRVGTHTLLGLGALYARNWVPAFLKPAYGGDPGGAMVFVRLLIQ